MFYEFYSYVDDHVYPDYFCCFTLRSSDIKDFYLSCGSGLLSFTSSDGDSFSFHPFNVSVCTSENTVKVFVHYSDYMHLYSYFTYGDLPF